MKRLFLARHSAAKILFILAAACGLGRPLASNAAQAAPPSVPRFSHIIVIIMENKEFEQVIGNARMPNLNSWAKEYTLLTQYFGVSHPSLPNYVALIGGDTFGIQSDCTDCYLKAKSLPDLVEAGGRSWKTYQESLPSAGFTGNFSGKYAKKHNPFLYFEAIRKDSERCRRSIVPLIQLAADLKQGQLPDYAFIVPNLCNSGHDCGVETTDNWLGKVVNSILESPAFDRNSLLVLTFDEGTTSRGCCGSPPQAGGGRIATVLISSWSKKSYEDPTPYSHYSLLKTIAAAWGLEELAHSSDPQTNLIVLPWQGQDSSR
jgi:phosphatidylinositol-3-phosphatase